MEPQNLWELLGDTVAKGSPNGIIFDIVGNGSHTRSIKKYTYHQIQDLTKSLSLKLGHYISQRNKIVLLHFDNNHEENIIWFWAVIAAGGVPCISTPFTNDNQSRLKHIMNLQKLLGNPLVITTEVLLHQFPKSSGMKVRATEYLVARAQDYREDYGFPGVNKKAEDLAVLMLTSGSTGDAKAVSLTHGQILASIKGKSSMHKTTNNDIFLNWTDFSHVANLTEIHLHALRLAATQVHVSHTDVSTNNISLLEYIDKYKVSYTFAPNFVLAAIVKILEDEQPLNLREALADNQLIESAKFLSINEIQRSGQDQVGLSGNVSNTTDEMCLTLKEALLDEHLMNDIKPLSINDDQSSGYKQAGLNGNVVVQREGHHIGGVDLRIFLNTDRNRFAGSNGNGEVNANYGHKGGKSHGQKYNLASLRALISGGESNVVETAIKLTCVLQAHGAPTSFIRPGFGMTETCAGSIYSLACPSYDISQSSEFASLGYCIPGIQMRVVDEDGKEAGENTTGGLQVCGVVVFKEYYNNRKEKRDAFSDGWFSTGDVARIDLSGQLHLVGRVKDTIIINGVNHYPHAIEAAIGEANIPGISPSWLAVFAHRPLHSPTEFLCLVYVASYDLKDTPSRVSTLKAISKTVVTYCGVRPHRIIPIGSEILTKSTLGKLSRAKIRKMYENQEFLDWEKEDTELLREYQYAQLAHSAPATTKTEELILQTYHKLFSTRLTNIDINSNIFELGVSSIDLLTLRGALQEKLGIDFPITFFFSHSSVHELATALEALQKSRSYDPIVVLQPHGHKTPIFFIHPGLGEVLIFMNLARYITDRPVYALRARGFDGEEFFSSMDEIISTYHAAIKRTQPHGPYALAGYSFGSILTYEITKRLNASGDEVKFLATFDQAPFFKARARGYDWYECVISLSFFLGLMLESEAYALLPELRKHKFTRDQVCCHILTVAPQARIAEVGLTKHKLNDWAQLAFRLKQITWDYDPAGMVEHMDIFWTVPLIGIVKARNAEEWFNDSISKWNLLVKEPKYHFVGGGHRTMISPPNLVAFVKVFEKVMEERGI